MKRGRVDLIVLIPLPRGRMMTLMSMLLPIGASFPVLVLVRQSVQQRHAGREKVRGERGDHN